ncbi:MAG: PKD domain-containing protein [Candidatus Thermoplasmatota archaeon]|nr:PKD domain-containing protein [Candidatus Thermoplasmatota archaeon]MBU1941827.1 PKD domain-containing protein [Candidatus Thermoplasmatota archaeon]
MISIDSWFLMIDDFIVNGGSGPSVNPGGPYTGNAGEEIQFTGSASGGTPPYTYLWDFGNGDTSDEQNPLYAYPAAGTYAVILSVTDDEGLHGSGSTTAEIAGPILSIPTVDSGLFKLKPTIRNIGAPANNVEWRITFTGGAFINQITEGSGVTVPAGGTTEIASGLILGIGATEVTVEAWIDGGPSTQRTQTGFVFLFFIKMNAGGGI